jgi:hypothetical protein
VWFCDTPRAYLYVFRRIQSNLIMPLELPADIDEHGLALWETADLLDNFLGGLVVGTGSADLHGSLCGTDFNQFNQSRVLREPPASTPGRCRASVRQNPEG